MDATSLFTNTPYTLHIRMPDGSTVNFPILKSMVTIGRAPENDLVINHPSVSRQHARIRVEADQVWVEDLGSSNGTFLNNQRLIKAQPAQVTSGLDLRFGEVHVSIPDLPKPAPEIKNAMPKKIPMPVIIGGGGVALFAIGLIVFILVSVGLRIRSERATILAPQNTQTAVAKLPPATQTAIALQVQQESGQETVEEQKQEQLAEFLAEEGCEQPGMILVSRAGAGREITSINFLDLPFPYDGGNENFGGTPLQFLAAMQKNNGKGGRINSFFDHYLPLYPFSNDPAISGGLEPAEPPIGGHVLLYDGSLSKYDSYSGHPGLDFSTYEYRQPTTPVFAAADGIIHSVGEHGASGALFVKIKHTVPDVGDFLTIYWHLHPDDYFASMLGREGKEIKAGTRIGTMGNTGFSTGHHLHFEVRFDEDKDGIFPLSEAIDPFGYNPSPIFPTDPWYQHSFVESQYLWIYPIGTVAQIPENGGGQIPQLEAAGVSPEAASEPEGEAICVMPGTLPPGGEVYWSMVPAPEANTDMASPGSAGTLSVLDANGLPVSEFDDFLRVVLPFDLKWLTFFDQQSFSIYWQPFGSEVWTILDTRIDLVNGVAYALTNKSGRFAVFGTPTADLVPPTTAIHVGGAAAEDGSLYSAITVTLTSIDLSGIEEMVYSLDSGTTWEKYTGPFTVEPSGIPNPVTMNEQFFGGLPGTFLVLASSIDGAGNVEDPPAYYTFAIDPTKDPESTLTFTDTLPVISAPIAVDTEDLVSEDIAYGPDIFPDGINPLTGQPCQEPALMPLSPALVSVTNFPVTARPQAGLSFASYIYELFIGEGMTRFLSMFYCNFPVVSDDVPPDQSVIGPIRSGRLPYESVRKLYNGFLVMASADPTVGANLGASIRVFGSDSDDINSALIDVSELQSVAQASSEPGKPPNLTGNRFESQPPEGGQAANDLWVFYSFLNQALWTYNPELGSYLRNQDNADGSGVFTPATDRINGEQLAFENVIVLFGEHSVLNKTGTMIDINLMYTRNKAYLFRDGMAYRIFWTTIGGDYEKSTGRLRPIKFIDANGNPFPMKPGSTWVHMVDLSTTIQEVQPAYWKVRFYAP